MKKLVQQDILPIQNTTIYKKIGDYTCVNLSLYEDVWHITPYYWRLADDKISLVEIGIDPLTGQFLSINVVLYNNFIKRITIDDVHQHNQHKPSVQIGIPTFSTELWGVVEREDFRQRFYDVYGKVQLVLIEKNLQIVLFNEEISYQVEFPRQLSYKFNSSKELCAIAIYDLSDSAILSLRNYEKVHSKNISPSPAGVRSSPAVGGSSFRAAAGVTPCRLLGLLGGWHGKSPLLGQPHTGTSWRKE